MAGLGNGAFPANDDKIGGSGFDIPVTKMVQEEGDNEDNGGDGDNEEEEKESRCEGGGRRYSRCKGGMKQMQQQVQQQVLQDDMLARF